MEALLIEARRKYHKTLLDEGILSISQNGIPSNADSSSNLSISIARKIAVRLEAETRNKSKGQTSGAKFEQINMQFLSETFPLFQNIRPGEWKISKLGNRNQINASSFSQYEHLHHLSEVLKSDKALAASVGNIYMVSPDIVVYRELVSDEKINENNSLVNASSARLADIRKINGGKPILHASISAKWTIRSDRAQNSRTEALGLIRNRKGRLPHIVVVTAEPMPSRIASIALGTGDVDCVYHFALYELLDAVRETGMEDSIELLDALVSGKRLKDISDLPLDLCI